MKQSLFHLIINLWKPDDFFPSSNTSITDSNGNYSVAGATYGVFSDKDCTKQLATLTTDENGNTDVVEVTDLATVPQRATVQM